MKVRALSFLVAITAGIALYTAGCCCCPVPSTDTGSFAASLSPASVAHAQLPEVAPITAAQVAQKY
jgi:hypothetical protein